MNIIITNFMQLQVYIFHEIVILKDVSFLISLYYNVIQPRKMHRSTFRYKLTFSSKLL